MFKPTAKDWINKFAEWQQQLEERNLTYIRLDPTEADALCALLEELSRHLEDKQLCREGHWLCKTGEDLSRKMEWEQCSRDDKRLDHAAFVPHQYHYISTVKSNGDGYDHFVFSMPEMKS